MSADICAGCGHANAVGARFCARCGGSLAAHCSSCGAELEALARFCTSCGAAVAGDGPGGGGALKVVSVVFSDLVGSTRLQEALEPESARRVMARFYEAMRSVVQRHEGAIQKFIGDAVVAVFGAPVVREDDALRAVRCAADMTDQLKALNDELERTWGVRLEMRTGVNTGELVVSDEGIFVGDTMNTAARLEQAAAGGQVLIGEATWRLVRREIELEEVAPLELTGKTAPVRAWRVISVDAGAAAAAESPLVGRHQELNRLRAALDDTIASRTCRLVTVIASPGLGKSRLASEFARSLEGQAMVLEGHCEASGEGITFLPVSEVLRAAAAIADDDATEQVAAKLRNVVPDTPDRERVVARIAGLLGAGAPAAPEESFWAVRTMLESLARDRPLVVLLDDVHWGQPMFLDLVEHLVEWARGASILLIALARPELRELRNALTSAGRRASDVIELEPLAPDQSRELVGSILGEVELPDELLGRILETTEGNPLFLGELLRMLVEEGSLARAGDVWVAPRGADAIQVPPTIQALLTARIERLRAEERSVVERAAVIGKQFYRGAVAELVAPPVRSEIDGHLETLRRKDMVEPEGTYWIDEPVYRFHHILLRDAAYHLLLKEARAELHERFADWLEAKAGDLVGEHEEVIAYHLEQAHEYRRQLGPLDERGRSLGERAAERLASAGRRALAREDLAAAANLLQRALDREAGVSQEEILWELGEALLSAGDTTNAAAVVDRLSGPRGDVLRAQLAVLTGTGSLEQTLERVSTATAALAGSGDVAAEAKGHHVTAQVQAQLGRVADAEGSLDHALLAARKGDDRRRITAVLAAAPRAALWGPSPVVRASGRCLDIVRILRMTPGNRHVEAAALRCQAVLEAMRGRTDAAREIFAGGRATLEELGLTLELHELAMHAGIVELLADQPTGAEVLLRSAKDGFMSLGVSVSAAQSAALLARALLEQGRDEEAIAETEYAEQHAGGDLKTAITWLGVRAEALARSGQADEALALARRAVALADPTDALADKADASMALARALREAGQTGEARNAAEAARALYLAKDHSVGVGRAGELASGATPSAVRRPASLLLQTTLGGRLAERVLADLREAQNARDYERLAELVSEDFFAIDHRPLGWPGAQGRDQGIADIRSAFDASPDLRLYYGAVLACDEHVAVTLSAWRGHGLKAGEHEVQAGAVHLIRDGRWAGLELYEPHDRQAMIARYAELGGGLSKLGESPVEKLFTQFCQRLAARELEPMLDLLTDDFVWSDHRDLAWEPVRGREAIAALIRSGWEGNTDIRIEVDEVLACDGRVLAVRFRWVGHGSRAGAFEIPAGQVVVNDGDRNASLDQYDGEDREAMLARFEELGGRGRRSVLGERAPERWLSGFFAAAGERRWDAEQRVAEDVQMSDHRAVGWGEERGRDRWLQFVRSFYDSSPHVRMEVDEVLACDERVLAARIAWRGRGRKAGDLEVVAGGVFLIEDGLLVSVDYYEPGERPAMIARYAELGGGAGPLGDRPPERFFKRWIPLAATLDVEAVAPLVAEDFVRVDHRSLGWEPLRGRDANIALWRSAYEASVHVRMEADEVLACDDRVIAWRFTWVGVGSDSQGEFEISVGQVNVIEDGRWQSCEQYDPADREAMLARFEELGATQSGLGEHPAARALVELIRRLHARDYEAFATLVAADWRWVDHRPLGYEPARGRDACVALMRSTFDASPHIRVEVDDVLACDDRVIAVRQAWRGRGVKAGDLEVEAGAVYVFDDGQWMSIDYYDPDDRQAMIARYVDLGGGLGKLGDTASERLFAEYARRYARRDYDGVLELMSEDYVQVDRRTLGWTEIGKEQNAAEIRSVWAGTTDIRPEVDEVLAADDRVLLCICTYRGSGDGSIGGGQFDYQVGFLLLAAGERSTRVEWFDPDDRDAMLSRYRDLSSDLPEAARLGREIIARWNTHDTDRAMDLFAEDIEFLDHRSLGAEPLYGQAAVRELHRAAFEVMPDNVQEFDEVLACDDRVVAFRLRFRGTSPDAAGGEFEVMLGGVDVFEGGKLVRVELFEPDDTVGILRRYAELGGHADINPRQADEWTE